MKKNSQRSKLPLDIQMKRNQISPFVFWNFVDCVGSASSLPKTSNFVPNTNLAFSSQQFDFLFNFDLMVHRRPLLNDIKPGSLVACVLSSTHQQYFPVYKKMAEISFTKVRTFFGHFVQQRNRSHLSSILLRVFIAGEFFLFRLFIYAPNILSFFSIGSFQKNRRSSFLFKTRAAQKALKQSRKIRS